MHLNTLCAPGEDCPLIACHAKQNAEASFPSENRHGSTSTTLQSVLGGVEYSIALWFEMHIDVARSPFQDHFLALRALNLPGIASDKDRSQPLPCDDRRWACSR